MSDNRTKRSMAAEKPIEWPRADPTELATFDQRTKVCTMNCGPHAQDPRTEKERQFLCGDCLPREVPRTEPDPAAERIVRLEAKLAKQMADNAQLLVLLDDRKREVARLTDLVDALTLDLHCHAEGATP